MIFRAVAQDSYRSSSGWLYRVTDAWSWSGTSTILRRRSKTKVLDDSRYSSWAHTRGPKIDPLRVL